jgi:hypothetical protein
MGGSYTKFEPNLFNKTGLAWTLGESTITQGKWNAEPPKKIPNGGNGTFKAWSQEDCVCNSAGKVVYSMGDGTLVNITWLINYGSAGSYSFSILAQGNNADAYESVEKDSGQQGGGAYSTIKPDLTLQLVK